MMASSQDERSGAGVEDKEPPGSDLAATVGTVLRDECRRLGRMQRDVAARARTSAATISPVERGDPPVLIVTVGGISTSLGMS